MKFIDSTKKNLFLISIFIVIFMTSCSLFQSTQHNKKKLKGFYYVNDSPIETFNTSGYTNLNLLFDSIGLSFMIKKQHTYFGNLKNDTIYIKSLDDSLRYFLVDAGLNRIINDFSEMNIVHEVRDSNLLCYTNEMSTIMTLKKSDTIVYVFIGMPFSCVSGMLIPNDSAIVYRNELIYNKLNSFYGY